jgi:hypothetical protein
MADTFPNPVRLIGNLFTEMCPLLIETFLVAEEALEGPVLHYSLKEITC